MDLKKIDDYRWELPKTGAMRVHGIVYASSSSCLTAISNASAIPHC